MQIVYQNQHKMIWLCKKLFCFVVSITTFCGVLVFFSKLRVFSEVVDVFKNFHHWKYSQNSQYRICNQYRIYVLLPCYPVGVWGRESRIDE